MIDSFRRLWPFLRPFRKEVLLIFGIGLCVTLIGGVVPILVQTLFEIYKGSELNALIRIARAVLPDSIENDWLPIGEKRELVATWLPLAFPILFFAYGFFRFLHFSILHITGEKVIASLRLALVKKIMRLNLTFHGSLERGSGGLLSRVFNDTFVLHQGLNFYADLVREPIQAAIYLAYMFWVDWKLTFASLLFIPFFALIMKQISRSVRKYGAIGRESMEDLTAVLKETVDGVRVVQSFNLEKEMARKFQSHLAAYVDTVKKITLREQAVGPVNEFVVSFLVMGFGFYSISEVLYGGVDGAKFVGFLFAAGLLQPPIKRLQDAGVKIQQSVVVTERIFALLDSQSEVPQASNPKPFPADWKTITFKNVSFAYGSELILKNVSLTVKRGETIALVGESGSGKSTLVNLLERFYDPTEGEILIDDVPIQEIDLTALRSHVALVTQDVFLFRDTVARNIQAGDFSKDLSSNDPSNTQPSKIESAARLANAHTFISASTKGYDSPVGDRGGLLSGGEKQRVSIARAIFKDAPILILDEATSALDSVSELEVQKGLTHLMAGRTAFVIAHRLSTVFNSDRILVLKKGEVVEQGTHQDLLAQKGEYHRFFQLQANHAQ